MFVRFLGLVMLLGLAVPTSGDPPNQHIEEENNFKMAFERATADVLGEVQQAHRSGATEAPTAADNEIMVVIPSSSYTTSTASPSTTTTVSATSTAHHPPSKATVVSSTSSSEEASSGSSEASPAKPLQKDERTFKGSPSSTSSSFEELQEKPSSSSGSRPSAKKRMTERERHEKIVKELIDYDINAIAKASAPFRKQQKELADTLQSLTSDLKESEWNALFDIQAQKRAEYSIKSALEEVRELLLHQITKKDLYRVHRALLSRGLLPRQRITAVEVSRKIPTFDDFYFDWRDAFDNEADDYRKLRRDFQKQARKHAAKAAKARKKQEKAKDEQENKEDAGPSSGSEEKKANAVDDSGDWLTKVQYVKRVLVSPTEDADILPLIQPVFSSDSDRTKTGASDLGDYSEETATEFWRKRRAARVGTGKEDGIGDEKSEIKTDAAEEKKKSSALEQDKLSKAEAAAANAVLKQYRHEWQECSAEEARSGDNCYAVEDLMSPDGLELPPGGPGAKAGSTPASAGSSSLQKEELNMDHEEKMDTRTRQKEGKLSEEERVKKELEHLDGEQERSTASATSTIKDVATTTEDATTRQDKRDEDEYEEERCVVPLLPDSLKPILLSIYERFAEIPTQFPPVPTDASTSLRISTNNKLWGSSTKKDGSTTEETGATETSSTSDKNPPPPWTGNYVLAHTNFLFDLPAYKREGPGKKFYLFSGGSAGDIVNGVWVIADSLPRSEKNARAVVRKDPAAFAARSSHHDGKMPYQLESDDWFAPPQKKSAAMASAFVSISSETSTAPSTTTSTSSSPSSSSSTSSTPSSPSSSPTSSLIQSPTSSFSEEQGGPASPTRRPSTRSLLEDTRRVIFVKAAKDVDGMLPPVSRLSTAPLTERLKLFARIVAQGYKVRCVLPTIRTPSRGTAASESGTIGGASESGRSGLVEIKSGGIGHGDRDAPQGAGPQQHEAESASAPDVAVDWDEASSSHHDTEERDEEIENMLEDDLDAVLAGSRAELTHKELTKRFQTSHHYGLAVTNPSDPTDKVVLTPRDLERMGLFKNLGNKVLYEVQGEGATQRSRDAEEQCEMLWMDLFDSSPDYGERARLATLTAPSEILSSYLYVDDVDGSPMLGKPGSSRKGTTTQYEIPTPPEIADPKTDLFDKKEMKRLEAASEPGALTSELKPRPETKAAGDAASEVTTSRHQFE
ncbi:unnamed protein product [Amoebophrya sp. A25]|nr:unnamed protein product [Amoebophrya sp. A25]|eukprot:GSA25T00021108001.1